MNFWKDGISINETKASSLVVGFLVSIFYAIYTYHMVGDFSDNLLELLKLLIFAIAGVNGISGFAEIIKNAKDYNQISKEIKNENNM